MASPEHHPDGDPCARCGLRPALHLHRSQVGRDWGVRAGRVYAPGVRRGAQQRYDAAHPTQQIIGIDGEGQGRRPHRYTYLAASSESGEVFRQVENDKGLSTRSCFDLILSIPPRSLVVGYAFRYDLTKMVQDLPARAIWLLFSEKGQKLRAEITKGGRRRVKYRPVEWAGYKLNFMNRKFTVECGHKKVVVWDIFSFFQSKFTKALIDWQVADEKKLERMAEMKDKRAVFDTLDKNEVQSYCQEECRYLAHLARALIEAHEAAGIKLTSYYGAGSTASAILKQLDIRSHRGQIPEEMRHAVACAFFGGRFENSCVGPIPGPVWNYDISSAYPYQTTFLPCLRCGKWRHVTGKRAEKEIAGARLALVHWRGRCDSSQSWGPFPVRAPNGTIMFPLGGEGGWVWKDEWLIGRTFGDYEATEAWVFSTSCDHQPFARVPEFYRKRCEWGKDARGIPLKLGPNSIFGKTAQSKGIDPPFQSWVWAGNITSGTRAQLLHAIAAHKDRWHCLMLATDGVWTRERLNLPAPKDTGTADCEVKGVRKPLGGWEEKSFPRGVFAVRPGIYFPLEPTEDELEKVRARGLGRRVLYEQWRAIVAAHAAGASSLKITGMSRFVGATSGVTRSPKKVVKRSKDYGEWIDHEVEVSFQPFPKRRVAKSDGRLLPWAFLEWESEAYDPADKDPEGELMALAEMQALEQPDADLVDLDLH